MRVREDSGAYVCVATNPAGNASANLTLKVSGQSQSRKKSSNDTTRLPFSATEEREELQEAINDDENGGRVVIFRESDPSLNGDDDMIKVS